MRKSRRIRRQGGALGALERLPPHDHTDLAEVASCPECRQWVIDTTRDAPVVGVMFYTSDKAATPRRDETMPDPRQETPDALALVRAWHPGDAPGVAWATGCNPGGFALIVSPYPEIVERAGVPLYALITGPGVVAALDALESAANDKGASVNVIRTTPPSAALEGAPRHRPARHPARHVHPAAPRPRTAAAQPAPAAPPAAPTPVGDAAIGRRVGRGDPLSGLEALNPGGWRRPVLPPADALEPYDPALAAMLRAVTEAESESLADALDAQGAQYGGAVWRAALERPPPTYSPTSTPTPTRARTPCHRYPPRRRRPYGAT